MGPKRPATDEPAPDGPAPQPKKPNSSESSTLSERNEALEQELTEVKAELAELKVAFITANARAAAATTKAGDLEKKIAKYKAKKKERQDVEEAYSFLKDIELKGDAYAWDRQGLTKKWERITAEWNQVHIQAQKMSKRLEYLDNFKWGALDRHDFPSDPDERQQVINEIQLRFYEYKKQVLEAIDSIPANLEKRAKSVNNVIIARNDMNTTVKKQYEIVLEGNHERAKGRKAYGLLNRELDFNLVRLRAENDIVRSLAVDLYNAIVQAMEALTVLEGLNDEAQALELDVGEFSVQGDVKRAMAQGYAVVSRAKISLSQSTAELDFITVPPLKEGEEN